MNQQLSLTDHMGAFCAGLTLETLPADVIEKARTCLLNAYGVGLSTLQTPYAPVAASVADFLEPSSAGEATIFLNGKKTGILSATLANSALFHGRGQEDTLGAAHIGVVLVPMLTAMLESGRYNVENFLPALVCGYEIAGLLEPVLAPVTTPRGLRSTSLFGPLAAAAAAARIMNLPMDRIGAAIGNAASFSAGILQTLAEGTDECRYQGGIAAINGLLAAQLASAGSVTAQGGIDGAAGLAKVHAGIVLDVASLSAKLGSDWAIHRVTFKPYPVCAFNQTPVIAALRMREQLVGRAPQHVRVRMNPYETGYAGMDSKGPFSTITGTLMSIPFCIALTLLRGEPTMNNMVIYDDAAVNEMVERVDLVPDENVPPLSCIIEASINGEDFVIEQIMTTDDFNYKRQIIAQMVQRLGSEQGNPDKCGSLIDQAVSGAFSDLPELVAAAFSLARESNN